MKNKEIERKFIVESENLPDLSKKSYREITQGYMQGMGELHIFRLRQVLNMSPTIFNLGEQYFQTIKGKESKIREEYEIELLKPQFSTLWPLCKNISLTKKRYELVLDGKENLRVYLDVYKNYLKGLCVVEVEFSDEDECDGFLPPNFFGKEVTQDKRYSNFELCKNGLPKE
jgi:adenylate cyclase